MTIKKLIALLAALTLIAAACGGTEDVASGDTDDAVEEVQEEPTPTTEAEVEETTTTEAEVEAVEVNGQALYESSCARCHGADGIGTRGPNLIDINTNVPEMQDTIDQIVNGGGGMPSFGARLSDEEVQAITDYVYATF